VSTASNQHRPALKKQKLSLADMIGLAAALALLLAFVVLHHAVTHIYLALAITMAFAAVARVARGVDSSGMVAGGVVAFIFASYDLRLFWTLLVVFVVTLAATRMGRSRKQQLSVAEREPGRSAAQVMANLCVPCSILVFPALPFAPLLALAAMAELAADTTSSELGTAFPGKTVLITTWQAVAPGVDGGISLGGTFAGACAAAIVGACAAALGLATLPQMAMIAASGTLGMLADSVLGAVFERGGYLNNEAVNLLGTVIAAVVAWTMI
jgi:uncharacterized protein (TIGR00297 family)